MSDDEDDKPPPEEPDTHTVHGPYDAPFWEKRALLYAELRAKSPTGLICGHCNKPMVHPPAETAHRYPKYLCSERCAKSAKTHRGRTWQTREGRVINIRNMESGHLQRAIAYLERQHRTGQGYQWLREEAQRRNLGPLVTFAPTEPPLVEPEPDPNAPRELDGPADLDPPPKRAINLKGVPTE